MFIITAYLKDIRGGSTGVDCAPASDCGQDPRIGGVRHLRQTDWPHLGLGAEVDRRSETHQRHVIVRCQTEANIYIGLCVLVSGKLRPVVLWMKLQRGDAQSETLGLIVSCDIVVTKQNLHNGIIIKQIKFSIVNCLIVEKFYKLIRIF